MRTVIHLSDLHFGRVDERLLDPLIKTIIEMKPNLIAVSGDLTQRARSHQFIEARAFLDQLSGEVIYDSRNTREILAGTDIECPSAASYLKTLIDEVKKDQQARVKRKSARRDPHFEEMIDPLDS